MDPLVTGAGGDAPWVGVEGGLIEFCPDADEPPAVWPLFPVVAVAPAGWAWCPGRALATYAPIRPTPVIVAMPMPTVIPVSRLRAVSRRRAAARRCDAGVEVLVRPTRPGYELSLTPT